MNTKKSMVIWVFIGILIVIKFLGACSGKKRRNLGSVTN